MIVDEGGKRRPCGELSPETRCPKHLRKYEKRRLEQEPWRHLYDDPRWKKTRYEVYTRDGFRCTFQVGTRRCIADVFISAHHEEKLRHIWARVGKPQRGTPGWDKFVQEACDKRKLRTLCEEHHKLVDNNNPDEVWLGKPSVKATSQHRRGHRSGKRRSLKRRSRGDQRPRKKNFGEAD